MINFIQNRYCDAFLYGIRSLIAGYRKQQTKEDYLYSKMLDEDCDAALLRLFYCVLNSAPQAVLQLTILLYKMKDKKDCSSPPFDMNSHTDKCFNTINGNSRNIINNKMK